MVRNPLIVFHTKIAGRVETYSIRGQLSAMSGVGAPPAHAPLYRDLPLVVIGADAPFIDAENILRRYTPEFYPERIAPLCQELKSIGCCIYNDPNEFRAGSAEQVVRSITTSRAA